MDMASPRISPSRLRTLLARANRTERPLYPSPGWDLPTEAPSRPYSPAAPFNQWTPRLRLIRDRPAPKPKPPRERKRRSDAAAKGRLREWIAAHLNEEPATWPLMRAADISGMIPPELLLPIPVTLSVIAYMLGADGSFTCHEGANLKDPADCRRLWSPKRHAAKMSRLPPAARAALYREQCDARLAADGDSPAAADRAPRTRPAHHGAP
jgi:hypothetical protein